MSTNNAEVIEIHHYLTLGGVMDFNSFIEQAKIYLMTKHLFIIIIDNAIDIDKYRTETNFAVLAHRLSSALALIDELIDANYRVISSKEFSMSDNTLYKTE